jgi:hypothetical protein
MSMKKEGMGCEGGVEREETKDVAFDIDERW